MLVSAELPPEFHGPVSYFDRWLWLALLGVLLVLAYYAAVLWFTRRRPAPPPPPPVQPDDAQGRHLAAIDLIESEARNGALTLREAHQRLSETVRSYVDLVTHLPARSMSLADFRTAAPGPLAETIALMYPPEFAPGDEGRAMEQFDDALAHARSLVSSWT